MSPLVRKEIRLLLPYWTIAMALAVLTPLALAEQSYGTQNPLNGAFFWGFGFGMVLLGLAPFGYEFSAGTFSSLMVQPMERRRIWRLKIILTAVAALIVLVAFESILGWLTNSQFEDWSRILSMRVPTDVYGQLQRQQQSLIWGGFWHTTRSMTLVLFIALTGGFWATLLFRQTGAALWFVILVPGILSVALEPILHLAAAGAIPELVYLLAFGLYSVGGFVWARRMFAKAQDFQWLGESVAVLNFKSTKVHDDAAAPRRRAAIRALLRKEFQSHQISFLIAFGLLVLHLCTLVVRGVYVLPKNSESRLTLEAIPFLWLLIPWLMGCVAIAEERKLGTMESQLCLPVTRRAQFVIKLMVVLVLGIILGGLMPALVEGIGTRFGVSSEIVRTLYVPGGPTYLATALEVVFAAGLIAVVSVFGSSLTRNTLHALGAAIVFAVGWVALWRWVSFDALHREYSIWKGPLIFFIGVPVAIIATLALSYSNYKTLHAGRRVWLRTLTVLGIVLVITGIGTAYIYQRPWEILMSMEPQHGARQLTGPVHPKIATANQRTVALLPDGRLWVGTDYRGTVVEKQVPSNGGDEHVTQKEMVYYPTGGTFVEGSNWVEIASDWGLPEVIGLRSDGTLWNVLSYKPEAANRHLDSWLREKPVLQPIGSDHDWKTVVAGYGGFYAIKTNGTLWHFGYRYEDEKKPTVLKLTRIVQVGEDSDWSRFFSHGQDAVAMKTNGNLWGWTRSDQSPGRFMCVGRDGNEWLNADESYFRSLVVHTDGTLWAQPWHWGERHFFGHTLLDSDSMTWQRLGHDDDWQQVTGMPENLFALKKNGRIVKNGTELFGTSLGRPSAYSDWLTIDAQWLQMFALASDGTLSMWADTSPGSDGNPWLAPSRRPAWSLNILTSSKN